MRSSYLTAGITLKRLFRLIGRNKISYHPVYLLRLIFIFQSAIWSSFFAMIENKRFRKRIENTNLPKSPVFIIGHWRTGSTLLHKLMSLDPQFCAPTLFQVAEPDSLLTSYVYYKPVMKLMVGKYRPMDKVLIGMNEPQEDEYAIYRITDHSPLEKLIFPEKRKYFLSDVESFLPEGKDLKEWRKEVISFYKKLFIRYNKPFVSKNPFNSLRIPELLKIFPDAKFIHIIRHPYDVVPSTINMWKIVQRQNIMNKNAHIAHPAEVSVVMDRMFQRINEDRSMIPEGNYAEIKFEDLDADALKSMQTLYQKLGLEFTDDFRKRIEKYIQSVSDFEKNKFSLKENEKEIISCSLEKYMINHGYSR